MPFRLPQVLAAVREGKTIHVVEGEKDVLALCAKWDLDVAVVGNVSSGRFPVTDGAANTSCRAGNGALQVLSRDTPTIAAIGAAIAALTMGRLAGRGASARRRTGPAARS